MTLSVEEGQFFNKLWLPLLDYVNQRFEVNVERCAMAGGGNFKPHKVKVVADKLWDDVSVIDDYLSEQTDMPQEHKDMPRRMDCCIKISDRKPGFEKFRPSGSWE